LPQAWGIDSWRDSAGVRRPRGVRERRFFKLKFLLSPPQNLWVKRAGYLWIKHGVFGLFINFIWSFYGDVWNALVGIWQLLDAIFIIYKEYKSFKYKRNTKRSCRNKSDLEE
jgi:hypothetical protein